MPIITYDFTHLVTLECDFDSSVTRGLSLECAGVGLGRSAETRIELSEGRPLNAGGPLKRASERFRVGPECIEMTFLSGFFTWKAWVLNFGSNHVVVHYHFPLLWSRERRQALLLEMVILPFVRAALAEAKILMLSWHGLEQRERKLPVYFVDGGGDQIEFSSSAAEDTFRAAVGSGVPRLLAREKCRCLLAHDIDEAPMRFFLQHDQVFGTRLWDSLWERYTKVLGRGVQVL